MMRVIVLICFLCAGLSGNAQMTYGFKTGLNFSKIDGPSETDDAGQELEDWKTVTGFQIGVTLGYAFTDYFSVRSELMYSKKGGKYEYNGQGYRYFRDAQTNTLTTGNAKYVLRVNNAYLDLPVLAVGRWKDFELAGGVYAAVLLNSLAEGSLTYTNGRTAVLNNPVDSIRYTLDYNYRRDNPGEGDLGTTFNVQVDSRNIAQPTQIGAYFDETEDRGSLYNPFDFGIVGELGYYLSNSLYLSGRVQYGLMDLTRNEADLAKARVGSDGSLLYRDDKDHNLTIQASLGFTF
jgi:hypothetical protein